MKVTEHDYSDISMECSLFNIESMHSLNDLSFVLDNLKSRISTPHFTDLFKKRNEIYELRDQRPFKEDIHRRSYIHHAPIHRMVRKWNLLRRELRDSLLDLNSSDKVQLKSEILEHF